MSDPIYCRVCGEQVSPQEGVLFGAAGKPLFATHQGRCAEAVRSGASVVKQMLGGLLRKKAPRALEMFQAALEIRRQLEQHKG